MQAAETLFPAQPFLDCVYLEIRDQMENFMKMLSTQAILLVYMAVGFYCRKRGIIEKKDAGKAHGFCSQDHAALYDF